MNTSWKNKRVMVTGANGFLASWIVKKLLDKEAQIFSLIYEKVGFSLFDSEDLGKETTIVSGNIVDYPSIKNLVHDEGIETIFHVGAQAINKTAVVSPYETFETNIRGTYNILEAARTAKYTPQLIIASSDKAYGIHQKLPYKETYSLHGEFPYEVSKSCSDLISQAYFNTYKLPVCVVRSGNIYGEGDWHFSRVIPASIIRILNNQPPQLISDTKRDFIYADDVAQGYIQLAEAMMEGMKGEAFNFGSGKPVLTSQLIKTLLKVMKKENLGIVRSNEIRSEIPSQYLSAEKAKKMIQFEIHTKLEDGLDKTARWYDKHLDDINKTKLLD